MALIISIDQSTSGTKGLVWDETGHLLSRADLPHRQIRNDRGWISHDPEEIYRNAVEAVRGALQKAGLDPRDAAVLGIANQRETALAWDRTTGRPFCDAIVWQCGRAADFLRTIETADFAAQVRNITGLYLSPYFSGTKFGWILANVQEARDALGHKKLCCGTIDAWLVFKMTSGAAFKTDFSNASRTQLLDLGRLCWNETLAAAFGLDTDALPELCRSDSFFGETTLEGLFPKPIPIHGVLGDSHGALFANRCFSPGSAKVTYGTGSSIMMNAGSRRPPSGDGVVTSLAWALSDKVDYALEGNINYTGAVIKWLAEDMGLIASPGEAEHIAGSVKSAGGVYLVPAFSGLGAPWYAEKARAAILGMNRGTGRAEIVRAAEESIAYQIRDVVEALNRAAEQPIQMLKADGRPARDAFLMQFQADMLGMDIAVSDLEERSGAGAAWCAARGCGLIPGDAVFSSGGERLVHPRMRRERADQLYGGWKEAVAAAAAYNTEA
jgi:glycerol kinase